MKIDKNRYRVFDKHSRRYLAECSNGFVVNESSTEILHPNIGTFSKLKNYTVEQCIGLVDKNKISIYEGDIVRYKKYEKIISKDNDKTVSFEIVEQGEVTGYISYYAPRFVIMLDYENKRYSGFDEITDDSNRIEIIGNINFSPNKK